jgi:hypothetical protein
LRVTVSITALHSAWASYGSSMPMMRQEWIMRVMWSAEAHEPRTARRVVGAQALEHPAAVMQRVREHVDLRLVPGTSFPSNQITSVGISFMAPPGGARYGASRAKS